MAQLSKNSAKITETRGYNKDEWPPQANDSEKVGDIFAITLTYNFKGGKDFKNPSLIRKSANPETYTTPKDPPDSQSGSGLITAIRHMGVYVVEKIDPLPDARQEMDTGGYSPYVEVTTNRRKITYKKM
jgi:hypothetical protein